MAAMANRQRYNVRKQVTLQMNHKPPILLPFVAELPLGFVCRAPQLPSSLNSPSSDNGSNKSDHRMEHKSPTVIDG